MAKPKKKFNTNPLDPNFPEQVRDEEAKTTVLPGSDRVTTKFADPVETERQTRKFNKAEFGEFESGFSDSGDHETNYQPIPVYSGKPETVKNLSIGSISLPENILTMLPYIPFAFVGLIAGIVELIFIPKSEPKVRYHAAQGIAAHIAIWIVLTVLGFLGFASDAAEVIGTVFSIVTTIFLLVFAYKAWQGKPIHIETVQDLTDWLEEKIAPQK